MLKNYRHLVVFTALLAVCFHSSAGVFQEDFSNDPAGRGWSIFGVTNLFSWDQTQANLRVTWDSSQTNSYFYRPLGTILARDDDFSLAFDVTLQDIAPTTKSGPFEIAVGLINLAEATRNGFWRGSGVDPVHGPRSIVEFDYFPAGYYPGWGDVAPSVSPVLVSTDNVIVPGFAFLELTNDHLFHIELVYTASNGTLQTTITCDGAAFGPVGDVVLTTNFADFRLDTLAICSYSDYGDPYDSVLAHGVVDNLVATTPPPPLALINGGFSNGVWQVQFDNRSDWLYTVERTTDFESWTAVSVPVSGNGTTLILQDTNVIGTRGFYRIRAERP